MKGPQLVIRLLTLAFLSIVLSTTATEPPRPLISRFRGCTAFNNYYRHALLPLITGQGTSSSMYIRSQAAPFKKFDPNVPGGPAGLPLRRRRRRPLRVAYSNLTALAPDAEEHDEARAPPAVQFTGTNVQVRGVDEPDIIKTDGARVFTLSSRTLSVVAILEGGRRGRRVGHLELPTAPVDMLIEGDYLLLLGTVGDYSRPVYSRYKKPVSDLTATVVYQVHIGKRNIPSLVQTLYLEGDYVRAREADGVARIVLRYDPLSTLRLFYSTHNAGPALTKRWNREIIKFSRAATWLPTYILRRPDGVRTGVYARCTDVYRANSGFAGFALLSVLTLRVAGPLLAPGIAASVVSDAQKVYSTKKTMYVTTSEFRVAADDDDDARWGANYETSIHKFALRERDAAYVASGRITGSVINQFAMHEWGGTFYVATTDGASWWRERDLTRSKVTSFRTDEATRRLVKIGEVGNLGVDERIYAVRYRWDTAYVVTFRETDPLYIIDIADPRRLRVTGELKIPGFSSYLHNVGPGLVLGVGQEATPQGVTTGAKVSLFDVSDKSDPKELSTWTLKGSETPAQFDHRAFLWYRKERIAVMPVNVYYGGKPFIGAIVLDVSNTRITERGRIVHRVNGYTPNIQRNAVIGGNFVWSMSSELLQVNNVRNLTKVESKVKISNR